METNNRRDFLKKAALAGASALVAPSLFATGEEGSEISILKNEENGLENNLIVPKNNGLKITGTFLDEIHAFLIRIGEKKNGIWISNT